MKAMACIFATSALITPDKTITLTSVSLYLLMFKLEMVKYNKLTLNQKMLFSIASVGFIAYNADESLKIEYKTII